MNWGELKTLEINKQIEEFNKLINEYGSIAKASEKIGISDSTTRKYYKAHGFRFNGKEYIKDTNTQIEGQTTIIEPVSDDKEESNTNIIETSNKSSSKIREAKENENLVDISQLDNIIDAKLEKLLDKYLKNIDPKNDSRSNNIEINSECDGNVKYSTYGVYETIAAKFNEYVDRHKRFTKIELVSQALLNFMNEYK